MRRRIVGVAISSVVVALAIFAIPLALAARNLYVADELSELESSALRAAVKVGPGFATGDPAELSGAESGTQLGLYDAAATKVSGSGPESGDAAVAAALNGEVGEQQSNGWVVVAVPVAADEKVVGVVRAAAPTSTLWERVAWTWLAMAVLALVAVLCAALLARVLARRLSRRLDRLTDAAQSLGDGDFAVRVAATGVDELDRAGVSLNSTAERLGDLVTRERVIAANASHQLRTPLSGLRATLEQALVDPASDARDAARKAIVAADVMESTIDDLIALTRGSDAVGGLVAVPSILQGAVSRWNGPFAGVGRRLNLQAPENLPDVRFSAAAFEQILDVLLENALKHGQGTVSITARVHQSTMAIDVANEGEGIAIDDEIFARGRSGAGGAGIGLALARELAEDRGGRLLLTQRTPSVCFTLLVPGE